LGVSLLEIDYEAKKMTHKFETLDLELKKKATPEQIIQALRVKLKEEFLGKDRDEVHLLIIEKQPPNHLLNVVLETVIETFVLTECFAWKVYRLSAIQVKRALGLPVMCNDHRQNKLNMINKIKDSPDLVFGGEDYDEHIADCIGLLNAFLKSHKQIHKLVTYYEEK